MYVKGLFEVFKILGRLGIKPKDIIGMGGDVVKMGKSLFNTRVNPKLLQFVEKNQKIPTKILEEIKLHARTLKNATESQKNLFLENIKSIQNAKTVIKPKQFDKNWIPIRKDQIAEIEKTLAPVTSVKEPATEAFKGWTPTVIKGGKDKLADGGITRIPYGSGSNGSNGTSSNTMAELHSLLDKSLSGSLSSDEQSRLEYLIDITGYLKFNEGGMAKINAELNQLPEYYLPMAEGGIANYFRKK